MKYRKLLYLLLPALAVTACTDDDLADPNVPRPVDGYYFVLANDIPGSRVAYIDEKHSEFESGDILGAFAPDAEGQKPNVAYSVRNLTNKNKQVLTPVDEDAALDIKLSKYLFYYPYDKSATIESLSALDFTVKQDQREHDDFETSDLLWDVVTPAEGAEVAQVTMEHAMATIVVKIDKRNMDEEQGMKLLKMPLTAIGVNLPGAAELTDMAYTLGTDSADIMMGPQFDDGKKLIFRAVVPACHTLEKGRDILSASLINRYGQYETVTYKLAADMELKPGYFYTFNLQSDVNPITPDIFDDDSWVYEVKDPNDGELVGYLCREYIYYAPAGYSSNYRDAEPTDPDYTFEMSDGNLGNTRGHTGYMLATNPASDDLIDQIKALGNTQPNTLDGMVQAINSQAWVFYNLMPDKKTPDLTKGTILTILYDIKGGGQKPGYTPFIHPEYAALDRNRDVTFAVWPLPHTSTFSSDAFQGIFKPKHGHERINTIALQGGDEGYAYDSEEWLEFYMHGGVITWDPEKNIVDKFFMPEQKITNEVANNWGHIAIKKENGVKTAGVSYSEPLNQVEDADGAAIGQFIIKNLYVGGVAYPLRKVCFNQFWIGKSLHNTVDNDGKDLECFNTAGEVGAVSYDAFAMDKTEPGPGKKFAGNEQLPAGFIYPTAKKGDECEKYKYDDDFDPYNNPGDRKNIAFLYNLTAFTEGKLKPRDTDVEEYRFPSWADMARLRRYGGFLFAAKWITDDIRTKRADGSYVQTTTEALREGMLLGNDAFCANISGLDFRAYGIKYPDTNIDGGIGKVSDFGVRNYFFVESTRDNLFYDKNKLTYTLEDGPMYYFDIFKFNPWDCWGSNPISNYTYTFHQINEAQMNMPIAHSRIFAPVRIIMSFKNPIGNGAAQAEAENLGRSLMPKPQTESRNVLVPLMK